MALAGVHVASAYAGGKGWAGITLPLVGTPIASHTMTTATFPGGTTSTVVAPSEDQNKGMPIFRVATSIEIWLAIGANPDATNGPRVHLDAGNSEDYFVHAGDKLAWIPA